MTPGAGPSPVAVRADLERWLEDHRRGRVAGRLAELEDEGLSGRRHGRDAISVGSETERKEVRPGHRCCRPIQGGRARSWCHPR